MPETVKRDYTGQSKKQPCSHQKRGGGPSGGSFPKSLPSRDGKYEGTAAGKTKRNKF